MICVMYGNDHFSIVLSETKSCYQKALACKTNFLHQSDKNDKTALFYEILKGYLKFNFNPSTNYSNYFSNYFCFPLGVHEWTFKYGMILGNQLTHVQHKVGFLKLEIVFTRAAPSFE